MKDKETKLVAIQITELYHVRVPKDMDTFEAEVSSWDGDTIYLDGYEGKWKDSLDIHIDELN